MNAKAPRPRGNRRETTDFTDGTDSGDSKSVSSVKSVVQRFPPLGPLASWRSFLLCCLLFTQIKSHAAVTDQSLAPEQYVAQGAPASDQPWTGKEYAAATEALKKIAKNDPSMLPRFHSLRSGSYFDRM